MAHRFNKVMGPEGETDGFTDESDAQQDVVEEEFEEYIEAYENGDLEAVVEEMADVLVTIFIQADRMGIDIDSAYQAKMEYNLGKSGEVDESGKVVDDASAVKPDFSNFTNGFKP